jgi:formate dehydrogenase
MQPADTVLKIVAVLYEGGRAASEPRLLGCVENGLNLRGWLANLGHQYVLISDKEHELDKHLHDTDILITTPFHPAYITAERIKNAPKLKMIITAGVGSDHVDLNAAKDANIMVAEVTGSNVVSVAEHTVLTILSMLHNFIEAHQQVASGGWDVASVASRSFDLEGKVVGTVGIGRIGLRVMQRLKPFGCAELLYYDYQTLPSDMEKEIGVKRVSSLEELVSRCDVVSIHCPLYEKTRGLFNKDLISKMKRGSYLVNTARGAIVDRDAVVEALKAGHLAGYGGDVWNPQPPPQDHPWRTMPRNDMTPHYSGSTLDAQSRYAAGVKDILERWLKKQAQKPENLIVDGGQIVSKAYIFPAQAART